MNTVACPDCDLLQTLPEISPGGKACCARCRCTLATRPSDPIGRPLALSVAALPMLIVANTTPLLGMSTVGRHTSTTIAGGAYEMWLQGQEATALVVAFCALIAPAAYILFMLMVLIGAGRSPAPRWVGDLLRWAGSMQPWAMMEVMLVGILVALIKIAELATVEAGMGMYAVGVLVLLFPAIMASFDPAEIWRHVEWAANQAPPGPGPTASEANP